MRQERSTGIVKGSRDVRSACLFVFTLLDQGWLIQEALARAYADYLLNVRDRHLLSELVFGIVRQELRLQWITASFLPKPL